MKNKLTAVLAFLLASTGLFGQFLELEPTHTFPELLVQVGPFYLENQAGAFSAEVTEYSESPSTGRLVSGYTKYHFDGSEMFTKKESFDESRNLIGYEVLTMEFEDESMLLILESFGPTDNLTGTRYFRMQEKEGGIFHMERWDEDAQGTIDPNQPGMELEVSGDKIISHTLILGGVAFPIEYTYQGDNLVSVSKNLSGYIQWIEYEYDYLDQVVGMVEENTLHAQYNYDTSGRITSIQWNPYYQTTFYGELAVEYDDEGNVQGIGDWTIQWSYQ